MKTYRVFLGIGSNLGERNRFLQSAADEIRKIPDTKVVWWSSVYESEPYGKKDQPAFLNAVGEIETSLMPGELLALLKTIEQRIGRGTSEHWGPREIDIDVLLYDGLVKKDADVEVPHPGLAERRFVLVPFREIAPDVVHPVSGLTIEELAAACKDKGRVVKTIFRLFP